MPPVWRGCIGAGELTAVWVPDVGHEAMGDLVRAVSTRCGRCAARGSSCRASCCARAAITGVRPGPNCTAAGSWGLRFEQAAHNIVLEDYIAAVEAAAEAAA
jgi:hypothetical protein